MELNPNHKTTQLVSSQWHKLCAILMAKFNKTKVGITPSDIDALGDNQRAIKVQEIEGILYLELVSMDDADKLAKKEGGLPHLSITTDRNDPRLRKTEEGQQEAYLVLSDEELAKDFVRPFRDKYIHDKCDVVTKMGQKISETYARNPKFYSHTFCIGCNQHLPVSEFRWTDDGETVGS